MNKFGMLTLSVVVATSLAACGDNGEEFENETNGDAPEEGDDNTEVQEEEVNVDDMDDGADEGDGETEADEAWYEELPYNEFDLEAEYDHGEYEAEYEYEGGSPEVEIEDSRDGEDMELEGQAALDALSDILPEMDIDENSSDEEIQEAAIDAFNLDEDYSELEVEIEFNGDETEVEDES
ncbi:YusW family protein [Salicibibacter kimchii]|nr:YusW family protein [Salicibibacter kimchii]